MTAEIGTRFVELEAGRFEVQTCGDESADRLALFLHGFPEHAFSWRHQLPVLAGLGYLAWAPNQRGYGRSPRPRGRDAYALVELCQDVAELIDASGRREILLIGHDWGGGVAWEFARRALRPLQRLVVMNMPHPSRFVEELRRGPQKRRSRYEQLFQLPWLPERFLGARGARGVGRAFLDMAVHKERFPEDVLEVYRAQAREPGALTAMLNWYRANRFRTLADGPMPRIEVPTLLIWGMQDQALGAELVPGTEEWVRDLTVRRIPDASHWVQQDAPEQVNAILREWLATAAPSDPAG